MARKKIVFVIVEGPSEEDALGAVLNRVFDTNLVHLEVCHCDLTSKRGTTADNICSRVCQVVKDYAKENRFKNDPDGFVSYICDSDFSVMTDYRESWKFIRDHSLERYTNFGLALPRNPATNINP